MAALFLSDALRRRIDRSPPLRRGRYALEAGALATFWQIASWLPPHTASAFGRRLLGLVGPQLAKSKHVDRNLRLAFATLDERARRDLAREVWGTAGAVLAELPHLKTICAQTFDEPFETSANLDLDAYRSGRRHGVFVTAHLANWEIAAAAAPHLGVPLSVVHASSKNPYVETILRRRRADLGFQLVSREDGARPLLRELGAGRSVAMVIDARDDEGVPLSFFGLDKLTTIAPARLALRFGCDLVPIRVERLTGVQFRVTICDPIRPDPLAASDKARAIGMMREVNCLFEQWIREQPQQWVCIKRAFPKHA
jgi:KDO2-lipid IV(A) lauroyltransferase